MPVAKPESSDRNASNSYCTEGFYVNVDTVKRNEASRSELRGIVSEIAPKPYPRSL
jgi:hypothetical protein